MKIAFSIERFEPRLGGGEAYARNLGRWLLQQGHEVHIFAMSWDESEKGFVYHRIPPLPLGLYRRYAFARGAQKLLARESFDIIYGLGKSVYMDVFRPGGGVHRAWMKHELRATEGFPGRFNVWKKRIFSVDQRLVLQLEKRQFGPGGKHQIIAVSKMIRDEIINYYHAEPERITVVYNGANLGRFTPEARAELRKPRRIALGLDDDEINILFLGHNFKRKGLAALIRALPYLRGRGQRFRVVVAGKGRRGPCDRLAAKLGVSDLLQYVGPTGSPEELYAAADLFCFPSYYDPCASVVLEALAMSVPVITSTTNGSGEMLTQGREGYVVDPDDTEAMGEYIARLFDRDARASASRAARELAESRPIEDNFREIQAVFEKALSLKQRA